MYEPINPLGYSCIKKLQRDKLWHAYNEPINFYSVQALFIKNDFDDQLKFCIFALVGLKS